MRNIVDTLEDGSEESTLDSEDDIVGRDCSVKQAVEELIVPET